MPLLATGIGVATITRTRPVTWEELYGEAGLSFRFSSVNYATLNRLIKAGDRLRLTQGANTLTFEVKSVDARVGSNNYIAVSIEGVSRSATGNVGLASEMTLDLLQEGVLHAASDTPLLPGRYVAFDGHKKLYNVVAVSADGFTNQPSALSWC